MYAIRSYYGFGTTKRKRDIVSASANLGLPLTSRKRGVADGLGDISLNLSGAIHSYNFV